MVCHTLVSGIVLGVRTNQLNIPINYGDQSVNQLAEWNRLGLFDRDIGAAANYHAMVDPWDDSQPLHDRVRSYLAGNCAHCHMPGGPTRSLAEMRYETPLAEANMIDALPFFHPEIDFTGSIERRIVKPGDPKKSELYRRIESTRRIAMPPIGRLHADPFAEDLIRRWIKSGAKDS
jgi:hypothetical protein